MQEYESRAAAVGQRNEAKRPMVERASTPSPTTETLLSAAITRLVGLRHRVFDTTKVVESNVDALTGSTPEGEDPTARPSPPVGGAIGSLLEEITTLEYVVTGLEQEVERLRGIA